MTRCLQGHTGYVHAVQPVPAAKHLVLSGACVCVHTGEWRGGGGWPSCVCEGMIGSIPTV